MTQPNTTRRDLLRIGTSAAAYAAGAAAGGGYIAHPFDPRAWLQALVQIGGGYALASGRRLWLVVEDCDHDDLASVMRPLIGQPDRVEAVRTAIEMRSFGEVEA